MLWLGVLKPGQRARFFCEAIEMYETKDKILEKVIR